MGRRQPREPRDTPPEGSSGVQDVERVFTGGGETGSLMRSLDWSKTTLGRVDGWPQSLRTAVGIVLESRFPMYIAWGQDFIQFYNDGYRPILGSTKHPAAMGGAAHVTFAESWHIIAPMFAGVLAGNAVGAENWMLPLDRHGYLEECYFTYSYSPIRDESGRVGGVLVTVTETTARVLGERRLRTLRDLADRAGTAKREDAVWKEAADTLAGNGFDVPFALLYRAAGAGEPPTLMATVGFGDGDLDARRAAEAYAWPFEDVTTTRSARVVSDMSIGELPGGMWPEAPHSAVVLAIPRPGATHPYGFLVVGVSPRRAVDDDYRAFLELVADRLATAVTNARAFDDERRRAEALAEVDRVKTAFFSNVSHEFRTPLTLMLGPIEDILADAAEPLSKGQRERLELIRRNGLRLQKLVNSLLDFARIEAGRAQASFVPTDLAALTRDLASSFDSVMQSSGLTFEVDCEPLPEAIYVDPAMWEKVVLNLLSNALKFTFKGRIKVSSRWLGDAVALMVEDTGIGIPAEETQRIFERFHRVEGARGRSHEGSGIGLSLVQELVKLHGGRVEVASSLGEGTAFTVTIPAGSAHLPREHVKARTLESTGIAPASFLAEVSQWNGSTGAAAAIPHEPVAAGTAPTLADAPTPRSDARILIADDNADMRSYLVRLLSSHWTVEAVEDGHRALLAARANPPDLVLSDVMMPKLDGLDLVSALRADEATRALPVVLLSARAGEEATIRGLESGADEYLVKPFSANELIARIKALLTVSSVRSKDIRAAREHADAAGKLATAAERATRLREETLGIVSHDLRSPLTAVAAAADLLLLSLGDDEKDARRHKYVETIRRSVQRMSRLVHDLLDLASIDSGSLSLRAVPLAPRDLLDEVRDALEPQAVDKGLTLVVESDADLPVLHCDRERLMQVVTNLISNAIKFTPAGGTVTLRAALDPAGGAVCFTVADTGCGFSPEMQEHAFDRHWHAQRSDRDGYGLGLSIAKGIVESHGGRISLESTPGAGSVFRFTIPREPRRAHTTTLPAAPAERAPAALAGPPVDAFIQGGGEMGALMRSIDWTNNSLGPIEGWPQSLRTSVSTMLRSPYPIILFWGPELRMLYNDPFRPILGSKHPATMGARGYEALAEEWALLGPLMRRVLDSGEPVFIENGNVNFERRQGGLREEAYFTWSYNPTIGEHGEIAGLFAIASETTRQVVGERQLEILRELSIRMALDKTVEQIFHSLEQVLAEAGHDLPFTLFYVVSGEDAQLVSCTGVERGSPAAPVEPRVAGCVWPLAEVVKSRQELLLEQLDTKLGRLPGGPWPEPSTRALLLPIPMGGDTDSLGVLVAGLSPLRAVGNEYMRFLQLLGRQLAASIASARAYEQEKQRAEDLARLDEAKTAFFSNVSHEFRTPLTLILGPVEDALSRGQPSLEGAQLDLVRRNALRLFKMVNTLLDFSRMEAGRAQATYVPTELSTFTTSLASAFQSVIEGAGVTFVVDCASLPEAIYVDPDMWEKVVLNLLSNAVKFTYRGEIRVTLRWQDQGAVLTVSDTGTGIPEEELPRIFDRFYRVRTTLGRSHEGTGIGLALVQELVKLHGGRVTVSSKLGEGTRFTVWMPRGAAHLPSERIERTPRPRTSAVGAAPFIEETRRWFSESEDALSASDPLEEEALETPRALRHSRILLVDDNADLRAYVADLLRRAFPNVISATNGREALELARAEPPDLVISDVMMPILDGFGLARALRADERTRGIPIILLSARAGDESTVEGLKHGADDYLVKPFSARELLARVRTQLDMTRIRRELNERDTIEKHLRDTLKARDEWLTVVSHELRTPVSALALSVQTLMRGLTSPEASAKVSATQKNLERLLSQIEALIDVAELASGQPLELVEEPLELTGFVSQLVDAQKEKAARSGSVLSLETSAPVMGRYDPAKLRLLLAHLLDNAFKFGAGKPVLVDVGQAAGRAYVRIVDHGPGIAPDDRARVLERFERAAPTDKFGGFGLGLWLARQIATAHAGSIDLSPTEGGGTTVTLTLPVDASVSAH